MIQNILGMNRRNACYTLIHNPRRFYPLVDNKLMTKQVLERHAIPTPELYFEIKNNFDLRRLSELERYQEFVIKPARGAEGRGILAIVDRVGKKWKNSKGILISQEDIEYHISNVLAGLYSLGGVDDEAFVEYYVRSHPIFSAISYQGVPDIRVVVYRGVPVMAMLRLPTNESGGRANLHQGAVGAGIDLLTGTTLGGVHKNRLIEKHPDTNVPVSGVRIPFWKDILESAARTSDIVKLGYIGADFVIDIILGPLILELNARPGLNIQLANREGLLSRLKAIDSFGAGIESLPVEGRLELSRFMLSQSKVPF